MRALRLGWGMLVMGWVGSVGAEAPPLPEASYQKVAEYWVAPLHCAQSGAMDAATAARGQQLTQERLATWTVDTARLNAAIARVQQWAPPTREQCVSMAIQIHTQVKNQEADMAYAKQAREEQARLIDATRPRQTYCNRIGTQTLCNSY